MRNNIVGRLRSPATPPATGVKSPASIISPASVVWPARIAGATSWTLFVTVATAGVVWVSWYTSGSTDFPTRLALWVAVVGVIVAAGACLRALIRHLGWVPVEQSPIEHAADGLAVVLGVILATALVGSTAGGGLLLTGIRSIPVAEALVPATPRIVSPASARAAALAAAAVAASADLDLAVASASTDQLTVSSVPLEVQAGTDPNLDPDQVVNPKPTGTVPAPSAGSATAGSVPGGPSSAIPTTVVIKASAAAPPAASSSLPASGATGTGGTGTGPTLSVPATTKPSATIAPSATSAPASSPTTVATRVTTPPATSSPGTPPPVTLPPPTTSGPPTTAPNTDPGPPTIAPPTTAPPTVPTTSPPTVPTIPLGPAPTARPDHAVTSADTEVTIDVLGNDSGALLSRTVKVVSAPIGSATVNGDGTITYVPVTLAGARDSFSYEVCDSTGRCATAIVRITIH